MLRDLSSKEERYFCDECVVRLVWRFLKILVVEILWTRSAGFGAVEVVVFLVAFLEFVFVEFFSGRGELG